MKSVAFCLLLAGFNLVSSAQSVEDQMTAKQPTCIEVMVNAAPTITKLYDARSFDSLRVAVAVMNHYCNTGNPLSVYLTTLLDIQQSEFTVSSLDSAGRLNMFLEDYPTTLRDLKAGGYGIGRYRFYYYTQFEKDLYSLIRRWAKDLLNTNGINDEESFICNILAGNIKHPEATLKSNKAKYPELYALLRENYSEERSGFRGLSAFTAGAWLPSGNISVLGTHPTLGIITGGRSKNDEIDLTLNFKFIRTPQDYFVLRSDSLYASHHLLGGYIGLDCSHYFYHSTNFEAGLLGGIGYDGFDINDENNNDHHLDYLKPLGIGSLNLNTGFRMNYFFNPQLFLGITARYNHLNYKNKGGTNMSGNAFTIDIAIGGTWSK